MYVHVCYVQVMLSSLADTIMHCTCLTHHFCVDDLKPAQDARETVGSRVHCALSVKGLWVVEGRGIKKGKILS